MMRYQRLIILLLLAGLVPATTLADGGHPLSLWQIQGDTNRIYLLGSIHLLREQDHPLPSAIYDAYEDADKLIMELDMDDMDPVEGQTLSNQLGLIQDGRTLRDLMGETLYAEAEVLAEAMQVPLALLAQSEPWYAAMNIEIMLLMRIGFNPQFGVETSLMNLAVAESKEILGLETLRQQLEFLDGLSEAAQRDMLMQALSEGVDMQETMDSMIDAWRTGDVEYLEDNLLTDMQDYPELNRVIVDNRNLDWTNQIEALMDDEIDYLIIVGALHLVGDTGVPNLLSERGHEVVQLSQPAD
jgi:uncharacterized protein YbaP (TraB family)